MTPSERSCFVYGVLSTCAALGLATELIADICVRLGIAVDEITSAEFSYHVLNKRTM